MSQRKFAEKQRGAETRRQTPVMLLAVEGKNKTEFNYFRCFNRQGAPYSVKIVKTGDTDPEGMMEALNKAWKDNEMDAERGDCGFVVLDLDCSRQRLQAIQSAEQSDHKGVFIVTNPCFELWFLLHFEYSTRSYLDSDEVTRRLRKYIEGYEKSDSVYVLLEKDMQKALDHAERLRAYEQSLGRNTLTLDCNPHTDVPHIVRKLITKKE